MGLTSNVKSCKTVKSWCSWKMSLLAHICSEPGPSLSPSHSFSFFLQAVHSSLSAALHPSHLSLKQTASHPPGTSTAPSRPHTMDLYALLTWASPKCVSEVGVCSLGGLHVFRLKVTCTSENFFELLWTTGISNYKSLALYIVQDVSKSQLNKILYELRQRFVRELCTQEGKQATFYTPSKIMLY